MSESNGTNEQKVCFISDYKSRVTEQTSEQEKSAAISVLEELWKIRQASIEYFIVREGFHIDYARENSQSIVTEARYFRNFLLNKGYSEEQIADVQVALIAMRAFYATGRAPKK